MMLARLVSFLFSRCFNKGSIYGVILSLVIIYRIFPTLYIALEFVASISSYAWTF